MFVRRMFADIDADIYLMVDGDATYDAKAAPRLIAEMLSGPYDMVNVARVARHDQAYRSGHLLGNRLLTSLVRYTFGNATDDMLSGYKAFSNRYAKSFPAMSRGFEIETELVVHALQLRMPLSEIEAPVQGKACGVGEQAEHLSGWFPYPPSHRLSHQGRAPDGVLLHHLDDHGGLVDCGGDAGWSSNSSRPAWCRGCRPQFSRSASCCRPCCRCRAVSFSIPSPAAGAKSNDSPTCGLVRPVIPRGSQWRRPTRPTSMRSTIATV